MDIHAAGGIVYDHHHRLLLVQRLRPPAAGDWTVPGGKCLPAEEPVDACVRELFEETGLHVMPVRHAGSVIRPAPNGDSYMIDDFVCVVVGGRLAAGDDAGDIGWFSRAELLTTPLVPGLYETLQDWALLPG